MRVKGYGYKVDNKPEFATVDKKHLFVPTFDAKTAIGTVIRLHPCDVPELAKSLMLWEVELFEGKPIPTRMESGQLTNISTAMPVSATCDLRIERDNTTSEEAN